MADPAWYAALSREERDRVDQALHVAGGVLMGLVFADRLFVWWREFVAQAPIERLEDTKRDMLFWGIGGTIGNVIQVAALVVWGVLR